MFISDIMQNNTRILNNILPSVRKRIVIIDVVKAFGEDHLILISRRRQDFVSLMQNDLKSYEDQRQWVFGVFSLWQQRHFGSFFVTKFKDRVVFFYMLLNSKA